MKRLFIETPHFTSSVHGRLTEEEYRGLQTFLSANPMISDVIPGTGGLRKMRYTNRAKGSGKRGGLRIIYLDVPEVCWTLLLDIYGKETQDNLSESEKKILRKLAQELKEYAKSTKKPSD
ncbi:MAG: hypothetical protein KC917_19905 [Candidatus Omnitrophica bacterium]|nr:hypothetical protein [Candidatus Omnitrophota bacterium]